MTNIKPSDEAFRTVYAGLNTCYKRVHVTQYSWNKMILLECFNKTGSHLHLDPDLAHEGLQGMIVYYQPIACEIRGFFNVLSLLGSCWSSEKLEYV